MPRVCNGEKGRRAERRRKGEGGERIRNGDEKTGLAGKEGTGGRQVYKVYVRIKLRNDRSRSTGFR